MRSLEVLSTTDSVSSAIFVGCPPINFSCSKVTSWDLVLELALGRVLELELEVELELDL